MTPPSLDVAREILSDAAAKAHASGDQFAEIAASAIDVVLAELDRRPPAYSTKVEVRTREHAIALFGRGSALAYAPLPFVMVDGTAIAEPAPGAPRVLCGKPVGRGAASCHLRFGHDDVCHAGDVPAGG